MNTSKDKNEFFVECSQSIPYETGSKGQKHIKSPDKEFWGNCPDLAKQQGCYVFGIKVSKGITPYYIGKATKSFGQEIFTDHKINRYNNVLANTIKGTPTMFLISYPRKGAKRYIKELEDFLIQIAVVKNSKIENSKGTIQPKWGIKNILRSNGKPNNHATAFKKMMGIMTVILLLSLDNSVFCQKIQSIKTVERYAKCNFGNYIPGDTIKTSVVVYNKNGDTIEYRDYYGITNIIKGKRIYEFESFKYQYDNRQHIIKKSYDFENELGIYEPRMPNTGYTLYSYAENGLLSEVNEYDKRNPKDDYVAMKLPTLKCRDTIIYDKNNRIEEINSYSGDGNLILQRKYIWNKLPNLDINKSIIDSPVYINRNTSDNRTKEIHPDSSVCINLYNENKDYFETCQIYYATLNNGKYTLIYFIPKPTGTSSVYSLYYLGDPKTERAYVYDKNSFKLLRFIGDLGENGEISDNIWRYDSLGNTTMKLYIDYDESHIDTTVYQYRKWDRNNNWVEREEINKNKSLPLYFVEREINYFEETKK